MGESTKIALIDGDSILYILAWQFKEYTELTLAKDDAMIHIQSAVDQFVTGILQAVSCNYYLGALKSGNCFRYQTAKYKPYKGTRKEKDPWVVLLEPAINHHLKEYWGFISVPDWEADDIICAAAEYIGDSQKYVICSPDKDLWQIPGVHYDYKKQGFADVSQIQAEYFFAYQMLVGDAADNVAGLPGFGEKKAHEKLSSAVMPIEEVRQQYNKYFGNYYGKIIFEENLSVLGLINTNHFMFSEQILNLILAGIKYKEIQASNGVFSGTAID